MAPFLFPLVRAEKIHQAYREAAQVSKHTEKGIRNMKRRKARGTPKVLTGIDWNVSS